MPVTHICFSVSLKMMHCERTLETLESVDKTSRILYKKINYLARLSSMQLKDSIQNLFKRSMFKFLNWKHIRLGFAITQFIN